MPHAKNLIDFNINKKLRIPRKHQKVKQIENRIDPSVATEVKQKLLFAECITEEIRGMI